MTISNSQKHSIIRKLIARDGDLCHYCGCVLRDSIQNYDPIGRSVDHIIPQAKGGSNRLNNLVLSCRKCNTKKRTKDYSEFMLTTQTDGILLFLMGNDE